ncbi:MAG: ABC transporter substrate-binding protein [Planctomycetota bacterium]|nr:ABC transporter substrate-binding protein [Planctomycetota bacterium]
MSFPIPVAFRGALALALAACVACSRVEQAAPGGSAPAKPVRIVATSATAVDIVAALVEPGRIAGFPVQALEYSSLHAEPPQFAAIAKFEAYLAEPVLALRPDLVVIDPWQAPETSARLREAGVSVLALPEVRGLEDAYAALRAVAQAVGEPERAERLQGELEKRCEGLRERAAKRSGAREPLRALCYSNFGGAGSTAGSGTTVHAMFELVGLRNLTAERGTVGHTAATFEDLLALDPDLIVTSQPLKMGEGSSGDRGGASGKLLRTEPMLAGLRAVREDRIVALPAWLFASGSHELVTGAEKLESEVEALLARLEGEAHK